MTRFKKKWILKAVTCKIPTILLGLAVVYYLTGELKTSGAYLLIYVPLSILIFVLNEVAWYQWKIRHRCPRCNGRGVWSESGEIVECESCEGEGTK